MKVNIIEEVGRSSGKYLASHCQRKAVIQRWINVLFQEVKVLSKHTLATPSYCDEYHAHAECEISRDKIDLIAR